MTYEELIVKARKGRSVSAMASDLGLTKMTLNRYVKGTHIPDYRTAALLAREAQVSLGETMAIMVEREEQMKGTKEMLSPVFHRLASALNRLYMRVSIA